MSNGLDRRARGRGIRVPMRWRPGKVSVGCACGALLLGVLCSTVAAQAPTTEPIHVTYGTVAACPGREAFVAQVQARTSRARLAADGELGRTIAVSVQPTGRGFFGTLVVTTPAGETSGRDVSAESCDEVVEALALITALTIDPEANTKPLREVIAPTPVAPTAPASPQPVPAESSAPAPAWQQLSPAPATQEAAPTPALSPPPPHAEDVTPEPGAMRVVVGAHGEVLVDSIAPHWVLAPRLFMELGSTPAELVSPQLGFSVAGASTDVKGEVGDARFLWLSARLEGCPLNLTGDDAVGLRPCVTFEGGILRGEGREKSGGPTLDERDTPTKTWLSAGMLMRLQVALADWIELRADGGLAVTLFRPSFVFYQGEERDLVLVHEVPVWAPHFGLGVGLPLLP